MSATVERFAIMKSLRVGMAMCALTLVAHAASAQTPSTKGVKPGKAELETRVITPMEVERILRTLAHDSMEGRAVGTPGAAKASDFIAAEMKRIGLKPAGDNGTYFQNVAGSAQRSISGATLTVNGAPLAWGTDFAAAPPLLRPAPLRGVQVIFGGTLNDTISTITPEQAAGKFVVMKNATGGGGRGGRGGRGAAAPGAAVPSSAAKYSRAAAIAIVSLDGIDAKAIAAIAAPMRASAYPSGPAAVAGGPSASEREAAVQRTIHVPMTIRITSAAAAKLFGGTAIDAVAAGTAGGVVDAAFDYHEVPQPSWTRNVVGIIPGTDPKLKDEWILIDAHYDHLGKRPPVNGDSVFNGADDDASGTTAVLEIARAIKAGPAPKRSMIFGAMTGEEAGLIGTNYYLAHPYVPMEKLVANMEIEMIGRPDSLSDGVGGAWLTGYERSNMGAMFAAAGIRVFPDKRPSQNFFTRSDNRAFACMGIPAHTLSTFNLHKDYHQLSDEADTMDFAHMTEVIRSGAKGARMLADGAAPKWVDGGTPVGTSMCGR
jgi:hypothetical protein